jgi:hypothetical protein
MKFQILISNSICLSQPGNCCSTASISYKLSKTPRLQEWPDAGYSCKQDLGRWISRPCVCMLSTWRFALLPRSLVGIGMSLLFRTVRYHGQPAKVPASFDNRSNNFMSRSSSSNSCSLFNSGVQLVGNY